MKGGNEASPAIEEESPVEKFHQAQAMIQCQ